MSSTFPILDPLRRLLPPALVFAFSVGCSSTPAEPGTVDWQALKGTLVAVEAGDLSMVTRATIDAMQAMGLKPMRRQSDAFSTFIVGSIVVGSLPQERELTVTLTRLTDSTTEITFHILFTRSREKLDLLLGEVRRRLAALRPPPAPQPQGPAAPQPQAPAPQPQPPAAPQPQAPAAAQPQAPAAAPQPKT